MPKLIEGHEAIMGTIESLWSPPEGAPEVQLPPPSFTELQGEFVSYEAKRSLTVRFPVQSKHVNPMGRLQGGFMAACIDGTMGPLSYLTAGKPTTTLDLAVNYLRGAEPPEIITITAEIKGRGFGTIYLEATVKNAKDKLVARATSQVLILKVG